MTILIIINLIISFLNFILIAGTYIKTSNVEMFIHAVVEALEEYVEEGDNQ